MSIEISLVDQYGEIVESFTKWEHFVEWFNKWDQSYKIKVETK